MMLISRLTGVCLMVVVCASALTLVACASQLAGTFDYVDTGQSGFGFGMIDSITFRGGTATMEAFGFTTPGVPFRVRGGMVYMEYQGTMIALFEVVDANTIRSDVTGFAGVYRRRSAR